MRNIRLTDKSVHHYLKTNLQSQYGSFLDVLGRYPHNYEDISLPTVTVDYLSGDYENIEIGTAELEDIAYFTIEVFARSKGERDDLGDMIQDLLIAGCDMLQFSGGYAGVKLGNIHFDTIRARTLFAMGDVPAPLVNRVVIRTQARVVVTTES